MSRLPMEFHSHLNHHGPGESTHTNATPTQYLTSTSLINNVKAPLSGSGSVIDHRFPSRGKCEKGNEMWGSSSINAWKHSLKMYKHCPTFPMVHRKPQKPWIANYQVNEPWSFVMETKTNKLRKDEIDAWTALFPEPDIARPGCFIPKFIQLKMYTT